MSSKKVFNLLEDKLIVFLLPTLAIIPCVQMLLRAIFTKDIPQYDELIKHLTLWAAMVTGAICTRENQHITLGFINNFKNIKVKNFFSSVTEITGAALSLSISLAAVSFSFVGFGSEQKIGPIPFSIISLIMAASLAATGIRFATAGNGSKIKKIFISIIVTIIISLPVIINLFYLSPILPPLWMENLLDGYYLFFEKCDIFIIVIFIILTFFGLPIFILLSGTAVVLFAGAWGVPEVIPNEMYNLLTGSAIPAIPLFTFTGFILSEGQSGERLVNLFKAFLGKLPGGLAIMAVLVCAFFTTFTGASGVTILALGGLLSFIMIESGDYSEKFTQGYITSAGSIGLLFPPSLPIIMYSVQAQISVKDMFIGGIIPGIILVTVLASMGIIHALRHKHSEKKFTINNDNPKKLASLKNAAGDIALPLIILVLYFGGITTLVETGAVAVAYSIILEVFIYKKLKLKDISLIIKKTAPVIGGVLMIVATAKGLSYFIVDAEVPMLLTDFFKEHVSSPLMFLLLLNGVLLITGCLMDIFSAIMVVAPLIIPLGEMYGINPVQLGIIFLANLQLGYLTPPVGLNLFLASYAFETPLSKIYKGVLPFFVLMIAVVLLITYIPWFSLALLP